jgi:integrase
VFDGGGKPFHRHIMHNLIGLMGRPCTVHGFRSTFATWVTDCTGYEDVVRETALGHSILGKVARAYTRGDLFEKRRRLMADWAAFCYGEPTAENVTPLRKRADG